MNTFEVRTFKVIGIHDDQATDASADECFNSCGSGSASTDHRNSGPPKPKRPAEVEHKEPDAAQEQGSWVCEALAGNVGRGAVDGFKHGRLVAEVSAANDAETADQTGG